MAMYNSSIGCAEEDSDITIINPSIIHENSDEQITNPSIANNIVKNEPADIKQDYIFVDKNPQEHIAQIEQILTFYIQDLKQEQNTQLDCDKQLTIRLIDHLRPAYTHNAEKLTGLDAMQKEIASLHDKRHVEQQEKIEKLHTEISQLNKILFEHKNESLALQNNHPMDSVYTINPSRNSVNDYEQWTEIEDDAKRLHEIVQSQKNQINEIVNLISQAATASASLNSAENPADPTDNILIDSSKKPNPNNSFMNTLLQKIQNLANPQEPVKTHDDVPQNAQLINHSPGTSPSQSLATLVLQPRQTTTHNQTEPNQDTKNPAHGNQEPVHEEPPAPIVRPIVPAPLPKEPPAPVSIPVIPVSPQREPRRCPVCSHEFSSADTDEQIYDHIETCLFPPSTRVEPQHYECPYCNRKLSGNDEPAYLQHLSDCINREF